MVEFDRSAPLDARLGGLVYEPLEADDGTAAGRRPDREPALGGLLDGRTDPAVGYVVII
jgi:hypothetical protein